MPLPIRTSERPRTLCLIALGLVVLVSVWCGWARTRAMSPYPRHWDEQRIVGRAAHMLRTGDLNPHFFGYPTLPIYVTAVACVGGLVDAASHLEVSSTRDIGPVGFPYYHQHRLFLWTHAMLLIVGASSLILAGALARLMGGREELLFIPPLLLCLSSVYVFQASEYLNVDVFGAVAVLLNLFVLVKSMRSNTLHELPVVPGVLVGIAVACKYNLVLAGLSWVVAYLLTDVRRAPRQIAVLWLIAAVTFLVVTPFALFDLNHFLSDVLNEVHHYRSGHPWFEAEAGLPQLAALAGRLVADFGIVVAALSLLGVGFSLRSSARECACILTFVVAYTAFMCLQQASFIRNLLSVFALTAVFAAIGAVELGGWLRSAVARRGWDRLCGLAPLLIVLAVALSVPWATVLGAYAVVRDSRHLACDWLAKHAVGTKVYLPERLGMDSRSLGPRVEVESYQMENLDRDLLDRVRGQNAFIIVGSFDYSRRSKSDGRARAYRRLTRDLQVLADFGARPIFLNYFTPVPRGNPALVIARAD